MNIPEIQTDIKREARVERYASTAAVDKPPAPAEERLLRNNVVNEQSEAQADNHNGSMPREELDALIKEIEDHLAVNDVTLKFNVLDEDDTIQVEILDGDGKTIRKIPDDDLVKLSQSLKNLGKGFLDQFS